MSQLKLYGMPLSNYFNMVKQSLLIKQVEFEEVIVKPNQDADYRKISPMGKVPAIETEQGFLSETMAIMDYIEATFPANPLFPTDAFAQAKTKELMRVVEHYIETPTHSMLPALFGKAISDDIKKHYEPLLNRGIAAFNQLIQPQPYLLSEKISYADIFTFWSMSVAQTISKVVYERDLASEMPGFKEWRALMLDNEITQQLVNASAEARKQMASGK